MKAFHQLRPGSGVVWGFEMARDFPFDVPDANLPISRVRKTFLGGKRLPQSVQALPDERNSVRADDLRGGHEDDLAEPAIVELGKTNRIETYADGSMVAFDSANRPTGVLRADASKLQVSYDDKGQISHYWESHAGASAWVLWQREDDGTFKAMVDSGKRDSDGRPLVENIKRLSRVSLDKRGCFAFQKESSDQCMITRSGRVIEGANQLLWPAQGQPSE